MQLVVYFTILEAIYVSAQYVFVNTSNGQIQGTIEEVYPTGKTYYSFRGMRYANPPRRFELSTPVDSWEGIYNATSDRAICVQATGVQDEESEDCLFINVYTPLLPENSTANLPVMFWVHGGAFIGSSSKSIYFGPDYLIQEDVIIVTLNYRLNIFGFLTSGDDRIPGNIGLKDIILGLQWVQENIKYFGGDSNQVTIFGESAGAALVSYLIQSPMTVGKGLFHKVIAQSGNSLSPWALQRSPIITFNAVVQASACELYDIFGDRDIIDCLKNLALTNLRVVGAAVLGISAVFEINVFNGIMFAPSIEQPGPFAAVTEMTYEALSNGDIPNIPIIMGINSEEGLFAQEYLQFLRPLFVQADLNSEILVPADMYASTEDINKSIAPKLKHHYFDILPAVLSSDSKLLRFISDAMFNKPFRQYFTLVKNQVPAYCYYFSYNGSLTTPHPYYEDLERVGHADDVPYIWRQQHFENTTLTEQDKIIIKTFTRLWTNFAKTGNPTPNEDDSVLQNTTWPTAWIRNTDINCLEIGNKLDIKINPKEEAYQLWKHLYDTYGHPKDTYK